MDPHRFSTFKSSTDPELETAFQNMESSYIVTNYKFGILYCTDGQTDENDMFANDNPSEDFKKFLSFIGDEITLKGWKHFRGGLDVNCKYITLIIK